MPRLVDNVGKVFHKYSFITHILNAVSAGGMLFLAPYFGYLPMQTFTMITGTLALLGIAGSFIKQEVEEYKVELREEGSVCDRGDKDVG